MKTTKARPVAERMSLVRPRTGATLDGCCTGERACQRAVGLSMQSGCWPSNVSSQCPTSSSSQPAGATP
eukprot:3006043-Pyramimonas_sp.AAC.1